MNMEALQEHWITSVIFEHACKENFPGVIKNVLGDKDLASKVLPNTNLETFNKLKIKPLFLFLSLLKKLHSLESFTQNSENSSSISMLPVILELLESTYRQYNFMSLKRYFTLISELKLLDLLNLIVDNSESSLVIQKLNQHFPRWTSIYRMTMEKYFNIENTKVLVKVEESHTQCRRLILKLAVDKAYKSKYMSGEYPSDMNRLMKESKIYIMEAITALEAQTDSSLLEKMVSGEETDLHNSDDLSFQLLLDYVQPNITAEALLKYLDDLEPALNSQPTSGLTSCLLPFDTMSEVSDDDDQDEDSSESEYDSSEDVQDSVKSFLDILPSATLDKSSDMLVVDEKID